MPESRRTGKRPTVGTLAGRRCTADTLPGRADNGD
jgi:hypothetical protein